MNNAMLAAFYRRIGATLAISVSSSLCLAHLDQTVPTTTIGPTQWAMQQFEGGFATFDSYAADDVFFLGPTITRITVALEFSDPGTITNFWTRMRGWNVYVGHLAQLGSGGGLAATVGLGLTMLGGGNVNGVPNTRIVEINGLNIPVSPLTVSYVGIQPVLDFSVGGQTFAMRNAFVATTPNSAVYVNPGNGFGNGTVGFAGINLVIKVQ